MEVLLGRQRQTFFQFCLGISVLKKNNYCIQFIYTYIYIYKYFSFFVLKIPLPKKSQFQFPSLSAPRIFKKHLASWRRFRVPLHPSHSMGPGPPKFGKKHTPAGRVGKKTPKKILGGGGYSNIFGVFFPENWGR